MQPRGATPRARSGAEAGRTPCPKGGSQEELPHVRGQGQWLRVPGYDGAGMAESSYPSPGSGTEARRTPGPKGGSQEELPHIRDQGQRPRVPGCNGSGTAEKSYPSLRSGAAAGRSYPKSEVRGGGWEELP